MKRWIVGLSVCVLFSCGQTAKKTEGDGKAKAETADKQSQPEQPVFPMPEIPGMITSEEEARTYLVAHFWDEFDFKDVRLLKNKQVLAQGLANFVSLSANTPLEQKEAVGKGFTTLCKGITENHTLTDSLKYYVEEYLYNPNSPYYNEELYGVYLKSMMENLPANDPLVETYRFKLQLIGRNCPGDKAENFDYYLPDGARRSLYSTKVKGDYLILVFYDPECHSCHDIMMGMFADRSLAEAVADGKVMVLAVYAEGDTEVWKKYLNGMPGNWVIGEDKMAVKDRAIYDLKAMPTIYLLDKNKKVLLKDAPYARIREALSFQP